MVKKRMFKIHCEEARQFEDGFYITAKDFKDVDEKVLSLIDIHEVNENKEIID